MLRALVLVVAVAGWSGAGLHHLDRVDEDAPDAGADESPPPSPAHDEAQPPAPDLPVVVDALHVELRRLKRALDDGALTR